MSPPANKRKTSDIWNFFDEIDEKFAECNICSAKLSYKTSISNLRKHLRSKHTITVPPNGSLSPSHSSGNDNRHYKEGAKESQISDESDTEVNTSRKRRKIEREEVPSFFKACSSVVANDSDEFEAVGINVAAKLKRMNPTQQVYAELIIQKTLTKGLLNKLTENTDLYENRPWTSPANNTLQPSTSPSPNVDTHSQTDVALYYETSDEVVND